MSIPQICPNCENHISTAHAPGCCYGTPEYAHLGWPNTNTVPNMLPSAACVGTSAEAYGNMAYTSSATNTAGYGIALTTGVHPTYMPRSTKAETITWTPPSMEELSKDGFVDSASAIRRLLAYLQDEPEEEPVAQPVSDSPCIISRLFGRAEELRKEADGMYNIEARAKRNFAADILDALAEELA